MSRPVFIASQEQILNDKRERYSRLPFNLAPGEINPHTLGKMNRSFPFIEQALAKIREGTYGTCEDCGDGIPEKRLQAVPGAIRCIACQEREDQSRAHP